MTELARANGRDTDPLIRDELMRLHSLGEVARYLGLRLKSGESIPGAGNISKLLMSEIVTRSRELGFRIAGTSGMLHGYDDADRATVAEMTGRPQLHVITETGLFAHAVPIFGGTDEIQRNILGERVLGLPKEPHDAAGLPWRELPRNQ